jgi:hypothetical protein
MEKPKTLAGIKKPAQPQVVEAEVFIYRQQQVVDAAFKQMADAIIGFRNTNQQMAARILELESKVKPKR